MFSPFKIIKIGDIPIILKFIIDNLYTLGQGIEEVSPPPLFHLESASELKLSLLDYQFL